MFPVCWFEMTMYIRVKNQDYRYNIDYVHQYKCNTLFYINFVFLCDYLYVIMTLKFILVESLTI